MPTYATVKDLKDFLGAWRLSGMLAGDPTEHGDLATTLLEAGASEMDSAFASAGYVVPIEATENLASQLLIVNVALAARALTQKLVDEPEGVTKSADKAEQWLRDIVAGKVTLLGIVKSVVVAQGLAAGRVRFVGSGEPQLQRNLFRLHNSLVGGM